MANWQFHAAAHCRVSCCTAYIHSHCRVSWQLQPCTIWLCHALRIPLLLMHTPCLYTDTLTPQYNPSVHVCLCAAYYPASIEVTLEKSVIGALKRNVGIATEQPLLPVSPLLCLDNARF